MKKIFISFLITTLLMSGCVSADIDANETQPNVRQNENMTAKNDDVSEEQVSYEIVHNNLTLWKNSIDTTWGRGFVGIKNTGNVNLYLSSGKFDIENPDGTLATTKDYINVYPQVITPGETAYYYMCTTMEELSLETEYKIVPKVDAKKATVELIRYGVSEVSIVDSSFLGVEVVARIENTGSETESMPKVAAILFDADGNPISCMMTYGDEFAPGEKQGVKATELSSHPDVTSSAVASYEIYAYPEQYQFDW